MMFEITGTTSSAVNLGVRPKPVRRPLTVKAANVLSALSRYVSVLVLLLDVDGPEAA